MTFSSIVILSDHGVSGDRDYFETVTEVIAVMTPFKKNDCRWWVLCKNIAVIWTIMIVTFKMMLAMKSFFETPCRGHYKYNKKKLKEKDWNKNAFVLCSEHDYFHHHCIWMQIGQTMGHITEQLTVAHLFLSLSTKSVLDLIQSCRYVIFWRLPLWLSVVDVVHTTYKAESGYSNMINMSWCCM